MNLSTALATTSSFAIPAERPSETRLRAAQTRKPARSDASRELRASQVDAVARREIAWFFTSDATDAASDIARSTIADWLSALTPTAQWTLAYRYDPMPCPPALAPHWGEAFALGLSIAATRFRHNGESREALEGKASAQLVAAVREHGPRVLSHIERRANWDVASAVRAYAAVRGRVLSVLPPEERA